MRLGEAQALLSCTETSTNLTYVSIIGNSVGGEGGGGDEWLVGDGGFVCLRACAFVMV